VLFLHGRRCGPGEGLNVCLNTEDKEKGIERALPRIEEAVDAGRLAAWVADKGGKVEMPRTERPRVDWSKVTAEVRRLAALAPPDCEVEIGAAARRLGQRPGMLDLFVKFAREERLRWERAPRFMTWRDGPGGKRVLNSCNLILTSGQPLDRRLNTDGREVAARRLRVLLWHAKNEKLLPGGVKHPAWREYGGKIPSETKDLLRRLRRMPWKKYELEREAASEKLGYEPPTIDWLTNHEEDRRADPVRQARGGAAARTYARKVGKKQTPISRSWQFSRAGSMLHEHKGWFYGRVRIDGLNLEWPLGLQNRAAAEDRVKPAVDAFELVGKAARRWRECPKKSDEAEAAGEDLLAEQGRYRDALGAVGAKLSRYWGKAVLLFDKLPFDEIGRTAPPSLAEQKAISLEKTEEHYFQLIEAQPDSAPRARAVLEIEMIDKHGVTRDEARDQRTKAIERYRSIHGRDSCGWDEKGDRRIGRNRAKKNAALEPA
jgi:hypothetical protein